jgi:transcriptional regulator
MESALMSEAVARKMYAPGAYAASDPAAIVARYPFAHLITSVNGESFATPTPILFETDDTRATLVGHMTRINPHAQVLQPNQPALVVFSGPHTYISASWYRTVLTVPTWDYVAAQVRGRLDPIDDDEGQLAVLRRVAEVAERGSENPWTLEQAPPGKVQQLLPRIRSFRITIERIEGVTKLNQTHPASDRLLVIQQLLARDDSDSREIARLMAHLPQ